MDWVQISRKGNNADAPMSLSSEQIETIISRIPTATGANRESSSVNRDGVMAWMREALSTIEICPSAIPKLIERIVEQHTKSLVAPGTPVGIIAAEAVGSTTTQMTLNSVAPWEEILIKKKDGTGEVVKIGEWIDGLLDKCDKTKIVLIPENRTEYLELEEPVRIMSPYSDGRVIWADLTGVTRHLPVGDLVEVSTLSGRKMTCTRQKSLLIWRDGELVCLPREEVEIGDLIAINNKVDFSDEDVQELKMTDFFDKKEFLYGSELHKIRRLYEAATDFGKKTCPTGFWNDKLGCLPYSRADSCLLAIRDARIQDGYIYPKSHGGSLNTRIPEVFKMDYNFGRFIGSYVADGCVTKTFVCMSKDDLPVRQAVYDWCDSIGITYHTVQKYQKIPLKENGEYNGKFTEGGGTDVKIHSTLIAALLNRWIGTGSHIKKIPVNILLSNEEFARGYLTGYFSGDGSVDKSSGALTVTSASLSVIEGFRHLCSRFGIFGMKSGVQQKKNNVGSKFIRYMHKFTIRNADAKMFMKKIGSYCTNKKELMEQWMPKLKDQRNKKYGWMYDCVLDPIVKIVDYPATPFVYDLTIPSTTNFSLFNGTTCRDTFHASGSSKSVSSGIEAMRDIIFARKVPKNEGCTVYFTDKSMSYEDVLNTRRWIVGSTISEFVKDYDIDSPDNLEKFWWHDVASSVINKEVPESKMVLRLFLDTVEMFKHHVSMKDIAASLNRENPPSTVCVYGPISDGILDIYPVPDIVLDSMKKVLERNGAEGVGNELVEFTYLETVVYPELSRIRVKGISGIAALRPVISPVWRIITSESRLTDKFMPQELSSIQSISAGDCWLLYYNLDIMRTTGLQRENVAALCTYADISIVGGNDTYLLVRMPMDGYRDSNKRVVNLIDGRYYYHIEDTFEHNGSYYVAQEQRDRDSVNINGKHYRKLYQALELNGTYYERVIDTEVTADAPGNYIAEKVSRAKRNRSEGNARLISSSEFVIAETEGENLKKLLSMPGIDKRRTTCNNVHTVSATLGIEATRTSIIRSLHNTISNAGSYVHPTNITIIAEFITSRGEPYGATYVGISRQPGGHLSLATLERAGEVFTESALYGMKEDIRNVSASVAVGNRMAIGNGYFDIAQDTDERTIINDELLSFGQESGSSETNKNYDLSSGIDALKAMTIGEAFDRPGEEDVDLISTFVEGETVTDVNNRDNTVRMVSQLARVGPTIQEEDATVVIEDVVSSSSGLVEPDLEVHRSEIPSSMEALIKNYRSGIVTKNVPLPTVDIPRLPDLSAVNLSRTNIALRRGQVQDLLPIDTSALINKLK